jgi:hypothetical protein
LTEGCHSTRAVSRPAPALSRELAAVLIPFFHGCTLRREGDVSAAT